LVMESSLRRPRVAVVGSGLAGCTVGHFLQGSYDVSIFEKFATYGAEAHSCTVDGLTIDMPYRATSAAFYPYLHTLVKSVGCDLVRCNWHMSFSVPGSSPYYQSAKGLVSLCCSWEALRSPLRFIRNAIDSLRVSAQGFRLMLLIRRDMSSGEASGMTFEQYLKWRRVSKRFAFGILVPFLGIFAVCSPEAVLKYPADVFLPFLAAMWGCPTEVLSTWRGGLNHAPHKFSAKAGGIGSFVRCLTRDCAMHFNSEITGVELSQQGVSLSVRNVVDNVVVTEEYDFVVFAGEARSTSAILSHEPAFASAVKCLNKIPHETARVVCHTDFSSSFIPARRRDQLPLNCVLASRNETPTPCSVTCVVNDCDPESKEGLQSRVLQTWNPLATVKSDAVLADAIFPRVVLTLDSKEVLREIQEVHQGSNRVFFAGAWCTYSMPLLESAVISALLVASQLVRPASLPLDISRLRWDDPGTCRSSPHSVLRHNRSALGDAASAAVGGSVWPARRLHDLADVVSVIAAVFCSGVAGPSRWFSASR